MERLTREQELKVIQMTYDNDDYIDNGGGRVVFDLPYEAAQFLGLNGNKEYIIKIALGEKGLSQNLLEIDSYERFGDHVALARIEAAGQVVEIMEKVDTSISQILYDYYDEQEYFDEDEIANLFVEEYNYCEEDAYHCAEEVCTLLNQLEDINGETADNMQIGVDSFGGFVAYDYGFDRERGAHEQCSDTRDYVYDDVHRHTLLNLIMELITAEPELFESDNINFMAEVETQFFNYLNEDDEEEDICGYENESTTESLHGFTNHNTDALAYAHIAQEVNTIYWDEYTTPIRYQPLNANYNTYGYEYAVASIIYEQGNYIFYSLSLAPF